MNKFDHVAAGIVARAVEAEKMPRNAAQTIRSALGAAGITPGMVTPLDAPPADPSAPVVEGAPDQAMEALSKVAAQRMASQYDGIITALLKEHQAESEIDTDNPKELAAQGRLQGFTYPDGVSEYELDGKLLVRFHPPECAFEDEKMHVHLRYTLG